MIARRERPLGFRLLSTCVVAALISPVPALALTEAEKQALIVEPENLRREMQRKEFKLKLHQEMEGQTFKRVHDISAETKALVKQSVKGLIDSALAERPVPSLSEIQRRINQEMIGKLAGRTYALSPGRARVIARTEQAQADGVGRNAAYKAAGVKRKKWLAFNDGKSGDRHHELVHKLNGVIDFDKPFKMPSGEELMFPGDPSASISETVNCRCTMRAVIIEEDEKR